MVAASRELTFSLAHPSRMAISDLTWAYLAMAENPPFLDHFPMVFHLFFVFFTFFCTFTLGIRRVVIWNTHTKNGERNLRNW
jgi:hypothetical protein